MQCLHLAGGSYGEVYAVRNTGGSPVAAKIFKAPQGALHTVLREMILLRFGHGPGILDTLVDERQNLVGYTMPLAATTLPVIASLKGIRLGHIETFLKDCAESLEGLHESGVTHGDVKGSNGLIVNDRAVFCDFGMACRESDGRADNQYTVTYRPPEMLLDRLCPPSQATDVWALGVTMYCTCLGERALADYSELAVYDAARADFLDHGNQLEAVLLEKLLERWTDSSAPAARLAKTIAACLDTNPLLRPKKPSTGLEGSTRLGGLAAHTSSGGTWLPWSYSAYAALSAADAVSGAVSGAPKERPDGLTHMQRETVLTVARNLCALVQVRQHSVSACAEGLAGLLSRHCSDHPFILRAVGAAYISLLLWVPQHTAVQEHILARLASTTVGTLLKAIDRFLLIAVTEHRWASPWLQK